MKIISNKIHPDTYLKYKGKIVVFYGEDAIVIGYTTRVIDSGDISLVMTPVNKERPHSLKLKSIINEPYTYIEEEFRNQDIFYFRWSEDVIKLKE